MEKYIFITYTFIIGIVFGSFFNVCIFRIPNKESISNPPSHCYKCNNRLTYLDLIPILSWILLKGKCRHCRQNISPRYPLIELLTGILFIIIYNVHGLNFITINYLVLISLLIIITFIDIDYYIIPDSIIIFGSIFAVLFNLTDKGISIRNSVIGGVICSGGMLLLIKRSNGWRGYKTILYDRVIFRFKIRTFNNTFKYICRSFLWNCNYHI